MEETKSTNDVKSVSKKVQPKAAAPVTSNKTAVILIRNITHSSGEIRDTLDMLRLRKKFTCLVLNNSESLKGMLTKVKDYATYGLIDSETQKLLEEKRGLKDAEGKLKNHFHLHPPKGGFERKGVKHSFTQGGVVGNRGVKINDLIKKML